VQYSGYSLYRTALEIITDIIADDDTCHQAHTGLLEFWLADRFAIDIQAGFSRDVEGALSLIMTLPKPVMVPIPVPPRRYRHSRQ
jgi:hypothetical protein